MFEFDSESRKLKSPFLNFLWPQWHLTHGALRPLILCEQVGLSGELGQDEFYETKPWGHSVLSKRSRLNGCESVA